MDHESAKAETLDLSTLVLPINLQKIFPSRECKQRQRCQIVWNRRGGFSILLMIIFSMCTRNYENQLFDVSRNLGRRSQIMLPFSGIGSYSVDIVRGEFYDAICLTDSLCRFLNFAARHKSTCLNRIATNKSYCLIPA